MLFKYLLFVFTCSTLSISPLPLLWIFYSRFLLAPSYPYSSVVIWHIGPISDTDEQREVCVSYVNCPRTHWYASFIFLKEKKINSLQCLSNKLNTHEAVLDLEEVFSILMLQNEIEHYPPPECLNSNELMLPSVMGYSWKFPENWFCFRQSPAGNNSPPIYTWST